MIDDAVFDEGSDIDVAIAFEDTAVDGSDGVDARLKLGADLALALGTDDVDAVDLRRASASLLCALFRDGERLVGSDGNAETP